MFKISNIHIMNIASFAKKYRTIIILSLIILVGAYLRLSDFSDLARFNQDQVRDAQIVDAMVSGEEFPLLGPKAGGTKFKLGPAFYYLEYLSGIIFGFSPAGIALFIPILATISIGLFYLLSRKIFTTNISLILAFLYATSFYAIKYSRFAWNPNVIPFFLFAFLLLLLVILEKKRGLYPHILLGIVIGIGMQLHTTLLVLMPILTLATYAYLLFCQKTHNPQTKIFDYKKFVLVILIALTLNLPSIIYDIQNKGGNLREFFGGAETKTATNSSLIGKIANDAQFFLQGSAYVTTGIEPQKNWTSPIKLIKSKDFGEYALVLVSLLLFASGLFLLAKRLRKEKNDSKKNALLLFSTLVLLSFFLFVPIADELNLRFFIILIFLPFIFLGLVIEHVLSNKNSRLGSFAIGLMIAVLFTTNILAYSKTYDLDDYRAKESAYGGISLGETENICSFIASQLQDKKAKAYVDTFEFEKSIKYICRKQGVELFSFSKKNTPSGSPIFAIVEKKRAEKARKGYESSFTVTDSRSIGRFTVFSIKKDDSLACKIGFITDVHASYSKSSPELVRKESSIPMRNFIKQMNGSFHPDVTVQGGDLIDGREDNSERAEAVFESVLKIFSELDSPLLHVMGNHETRSGGISKTEWQEESKQKNSYYSYDCKDVQLIILDGMDSATESNYALSENQLTWLEETFKQNPGRNKIVFIHESLVPRGKISVKLNAEREFSDQDARNMKALFSRNDVLTVFSGHAEALFHTEESGVDYYVLPGVLKSKDEAVSWLQSFYEITAADDIDITMRYKKDMSEKEYRVLQIPSEEFDAIEK